MSTRQITHTLKDTSLGRPSEEEWEIVEPTWIAYWKHAHSALRERTFQHDGVTIKVDLDWTPYSRRLLKRHNLMAPVRRGENADPQWFEKLDRPLKLKATCSVGGKNKFSRHPWYSEFFLKYYLYEVFMCANLACPGSADFLTLRLEGSAGTESDRLGLSSYYFDEWLVESIRGGPLKVSVLDPVDVGRWIREVNPTVTQRAESGTQRALFAIYHMCHSDGRIDFVVWLFTALESLLSTRVGENFGGIVRRAALVLRLDGTAQKLLARQLRKLYDLRSAFVHGGYPVSHPLHYETIDPRLDGDYAEVLRASAYGFSLLAAILQAMIATKRHTLRFEERLDDDCGAA
jgi:hypothetical protein